MKTYQKIAHVQAVQFMGNVNEIVELVGAKSYSYRSDSFTYAELHVCSPSVNLTMRTGDYVVIQQDSAPYVVAKDVFEKTYREVIQ